MRGFLPVPLTVCVLAGAPALAQEFRFAPALTLAEVYDDGLSPRSAGPAEALALRLSPQLSSDYASARLFLLARAGFDADIFKARSERIAPSARMGELQVRALATQRLTLSAGATYRETNIPRDLYAQTGFDPGLFEVKSFDVSTSAAYRLTPLANASVAYAFTRTAQGGLLTDNQSLVPALEEEIGPRDKARLEVLARRLSFHGQFAQEAVVPMPGWTPDGVEASASLRAEASAVRASLTYSATQMAVAGLVGAVNTQSVSVAVTCKLSDRLALRESSDPAILRFDGDRAAPGRRLRLAAGNRAPARARRSGAAARVPDRSRRCDRDRRLEERSREPHDTGAARRPHLLAPAQRRPGGRAHPDGAAPGAGGEAGRLRAQPRDLRHRAAGAQLQGVRLRRGGAPGAVRVEGPHHGARDSRQRRRADALRVEVGDLPPPAPGERDGADRD